MTRKLLLLATIAALALAGCGGDDDETTTTSSTATTTTGATGATGASGEEGDQPADAGLAGDPKERSDEITTCLEDDGHTVIENKGGEGGADFHLVVDAGFAGVAYVFSDDAAAEDGLPAVEKSESGTGRDVEQLGDVVIGWMKESEKADLEACVEG